MIFQQNSYKKSRIVYTCDLCQFEAATLNLLKQHKQSLHNPITSDECAIKITTSKCDIIGNNTNELSLSSETAYIDVKIEQPTLDLIENSIKQEEEEHVTNPLGFQCEVCNKIYEHEQSLKRHQKLSCSGQPQSYKISFEDGRKLYCCLECDYKGIASLF